MGDKLVLDLETQREFNEVEGRKPELLGVSVVGVYSYQGAVANRALYLLGKTLGLFTEPVPSDDPEGAPLAPDAARDRLARRIARLFAEDDEDDADR